MQQRHVQVQKINFILNIPNMSFLDIYNQNLLDRLSLSQARDKFQEMVRENSFWSARHLNLIKLVEDGIAPVEDCRLKRYGIDLKEVKNFDLKDYFPLRSAVNSTYPDLQAEANRQEKQYQLIKSISEKYPKWEDDFGGHRRDVMYWQSNPDAKAIAKEQQSQYEAEIEAAVHSHSQIFDTP